jgi:hypothetical protein
LPVFPGGCPDAFTPRYRLWYVKMAMERAAQTCSSGHPQRFFEPLIPTPVLNRMDRRDILMIMAMLLLAVAATWAGTDYVVNQVVLPLTEDEPAPSPGVSNPKFASFRVGLLSELQPRRTLDSWDSNGLVHTFACWTRCETEANF